MNPTLIAYPPGLSPENQLRTLSHNAQAALALGRHMVDSGAARMTIPIEVSNQHFVITISKSRSRRQRVVKNPSIALSSGSLDTHKQETNETDDTNENISLDAYINKK